MYIFEDTINDEIQTDTIVTTGFFDGLHAGHIKIITEVIQQAQFFKKKSLVITYWPSPQSIFSDKKQKMLLTKEEKIEEFKKIKGLDLLAMIHFDRDFANISAKDFIKEFLIKKCRAVKYILGYNHHFGKNKEGCFAFTQKHSFPIDILQCSSLSINNRKEGLVSSSKIRSLLYNGDMEMAFTMLKKNYSLTGKVIKGKGKGVEIGFPTANLQIPNIKLIPKNGVYSAKTNIKGKIYEAIVNIGTQPTVVVTEKVSIEVHILNFHDNLYDQILKVDLIKYIREEKKFHSIEQLSQQISHDIKKI